MSSCTCTYGVDTCPVCCGRLQVRGRTCPSCNGRGTSGHMVMIRKDPNCPDHGDKTPANETAGKGHK